MQLVQVNTSNVETFNFLKIKGVYERVRLNNETSNCLEYNLVNLTREIFKITINYSDNTVSVNDNVFKVIPYTEFAWKFCKRSKTVKTGSLDRLGKSLKNACNKNDVFHSAVYSMLKGIVAEPVKN